MSVQELQQAAMALPWADRLSLAQALWEDIYGEQPEQEETALMREVMRRDREVVSGAVVGRPFEEFIQAARRTIGCE